MDSIESLNKDYTKFNMALKLLKQHFEVITSIQNKASISMFDKVVKSISVLDDLSKQIDFDDFPFISEVYSLSKKYRLCLNNITEYKKTLLDKSDCSIHESSRCAHALATARNDFITVKESFEQKYNYMINSADDINNIISISFKNAEESAEKKIEAIKKSARLLLSKETTIELKLSDEIKTDELLPTHMLVYNIPTKRVSLPLLIDLGFSKTSEKYYVDLRNQGNVLVSSTFENANDERIDSFVISYIIRFIESFPLGAANVHIFDQNPGILFKRLTNAFQNEDASELTQKVVQLHTCINDITTFRDVICDDIFKKTSNAKPDLFSVYEEDKSDAFNLIVIKNGLVDGSGYATSDTLNLINSLSKPNDIGHKCGLRFLIMDTSCSFEKQMTAITKHLVQQIQQNCALCISFDGSFIADGKNIDVLHINGSIDKYIQERSSALANAINRKEQNSVSISEISNGAGKQEIGSIMFIPVGKSGNSIVELPFSCRDESGTVAGQCIGYMAIGQSGSGKSSFFHSLVINGCLKYSPDDLQFWLLDFKNGGASSKYRYSGIPHIKIIAENNKIDDALCLFQMVLEEMERRIKRFNSAFVDNIVDYNKIAADKALEHMPRIIIAIDEVQEIFREDNAQELQKQISSISTRMRSTGMHFVMVAQNLSEGKSYMLKDAFLPSATGRICFRVSPDIPRDSGFGDDFIQRKNEISILKTGEAYVGYGKDTIKKVKIAFTSPDEMNTVTKIKLLRSNDLGFFSSHSEGAIKEIRISGNKRFSANDNFLPTDEIEIIVYTKKSGCDDIINIAP